MTHTKLIQDSEGNVRPLHQPLMSSNPYSSMFSYDRDIDSLKSLSETVREGIRKLMLMREYAKADKMCDMLEAVEEQIQILE